MKEYSAKPSPNCGGCQEYKEKCNCLCHFRIQCFGYHENFFEVNSIKRSGFFKRIYNKLMDNNRI